MPSSFSFFFFFKQKTAYEMRISDWSSDVCSSDLTPASQAFVADFQKKHGKPPVNHAWIEYIALKLLARAMEETKSTDTEKLVDFFVNGAQFDILTARPAYFRAWDHPSIHQDSHFPVTASGDA